LTGLTIAYLLRHSGVKVTIIEARKRLGGRIYTKYNAGSPPLEMGATWLGKAHTELLALLEELGLEIFDQKIGDTAIYEPMSTSPPQLVRIPPNSDPSFRIKGGTDSIIQALSDTLKMDQIFTGQVVTSIQRGKESSVVKTLNMSFHGKLVISTLPPYLFIHQINVIPALPFELIEIAKHTHTWMGESIKIALTYDVPFWDDEQLSSTIFSNVGPIPEMYEHSDFQEKHFALKGFLNGVYFDLSKKERLKLILNQLNKYYGNKAANFTHYEELIWTNEKFTSTPYSDNILPHANNGHRLYQQSYLNNSLFFAGTETSPMFYGYMEGAVRSAKNVIGSIKKLQSHLFATGI